MQLCIFNCFVCGFTAHFLVFARRAFIFQSIKMKQKSCSIIRSARNAYATPPVIELRLRFFFGADLNHTIVIFVFLFLFLFGTAIVGVKK